MTSKDFLQTYMFSLLPLSLSELHLTTSCLFECPCLLVDQIKHHTWSTGMPIGVAIQAQFDYHRKFLC